VKVVFLDFDGTLNGLETREPPSPIHPGLFLNPVLVERVNRICEATGARVVLSCSWRTRRHVVGAPDAHLSLDELREALRLAGAQFEVVDKTPDLAREDSIGRDGEAVKLWRCPPRRKEIAAWIERHQPEAFVILDDDRDAAIDAHFVGCNPKFGLSNEGVVEAIRILGIDPGVRLARVLDAVAESVVAATDDELAEDAAIEGRDLEADAERVRGVLLAAVEKGAGR
jgi:hypothetical protein